jgi:hypothetical protein
MRSTDPLKSFSPTPRCSGLADVFLYPSLPRLRTLTELNLRSHQLDLYLDTFLDFLEENRSPESGIRRRLRLAFLLLTFRIYNHPSLRSIVPTRESFAFTVSSGC